MLAQARSRCPPGAIAGVILAVGGNQAPAAKEQAAQRGPLWVSSDCDARARGAQLGCPAAKLVLPVNDRALLAV
jgi:hypothetical protein